MSIDKKELTKLLGFMITFDGGVYRKTKTENAYFMMNMREENLDYVQWVQDVLSNFVGSSIKSRHDVNYDGFNRKPQVTLLSKRHPLLTNMRERIYVANHKVIDLHLLKLLDAEALAIIFMTDGSAVLDQRFKNPHCSITLNSKGFSEADNLALSKAIYQNMGIRTQVQKQHQYRYLRIKGADVVRFCDLITPFILPSFFYKLERIAPAIKYKLGLGDDMSWPNW